MIKKSLFKISFWYVHYGSKLYQWIYDQLPSLNELIDRAFIPEEEQEEIERENSAVVTEQQLHNFALERGLKMPCHRCGSGDHTVRLEERTYHVISKVICERCNTSIQSDPEPKGQPSYHYIQCGVFAYHLHTLYYNTYN